MSLLPAPFDLFLQILLYLKGGDNSFGAFGVVGCPFGS